MNEDKPSGDTVEGDKTSGDVIEGDKTGDVVEGDKTVVEPPAATPAKETDAPERMVQGG